MESEDESEDDDSEYSEASEDSDDSEGKIVFLFMIYSYNGGRVYKY